jgi:hypothetical protein
MRVSEAQIVPRRSAEQMQKLLDESPLTVGYATRFRLPE